MDQDNSCECSGRRRKNWMPPGAQLLEVQCVSCECAVERGASGLTNVQGGAANSHLADPVNSGGWADSGFAHASSNSGVQAETDFLGNVYWYDPITGILMKNGEQLIGSSYVQSFTSSIRPDPDVPPVVGPPISICGPDITNSLVEIVNTVSQHKKSPVNYRGQDIVRSIPPKELKRAVSDPMRLDLKWQSVPYDSSTDFNNDGTRDGMRPVDIDGDGEPECPVNCPPNGLKQMHGCVTLCGECLEGSVPGNFLSGYLATLTAGYLGTRFAIGTGSRDDLELVYGWTNPIITSWHRAFVTCGIMDPCDPEDAAAMEAGGALTEKFSVEHGVRISRKDVCDALSEAIAAGALQKGNCECRACEFSGKYKNISIKWTEPMQVGFDPFHQFQIGTIVRLGR